MRNSAKPEIKVARPPGKDNRWWALGDRSDAGRTDVNGGVLYEAPRHYLADRPGLHLTDASTVMNQRRTRNTEEQQSIQTG